MKKIINGLIITVCLGLFSQQAQASFFFEPFVGTAIGGTWTVGTEDGGVSATDYGLRLGMGFAGFDLGIEYGMGNQTWDALPSDLEFSHTNLGLFVAFTLPAMLRFHATYFFDSKGELDLLGTTATYSGGGYKVGVGYTGLAFMIVSLEMMSTSWDKVEATILGVTTESDLTDTLDSNTTMLSLSFPLP